MILTEEEAKKIICPKYRAALLSNPAFTDSGRKFDSSLFDAMLCDASDCMMWVWNTDEGSKGHCGLAGG